jgi:hypothetical protein
MPRSSVLEALLVLLWEKAEAIVAILPFLHHINPPSQILDGLYLGAYAPYNAFPLVDWLKRERITHLLSVGANHPSYDAIVLRIDIVDSASEDLSSSLVSAVKFIHDARSNGGRILVHCSMGASRSAAVIIAYIMAASDLDRERALEFTVCRRPLVGPNAGFWEQLGAFNGGDCALMNNLLTENDHTFIKNELASNDQAGMHVLRGWKWRLELMKLLWRPLSTVGGVALLLGGSWRWAQRRQGKAQRAGAASRL